MAFVEGRWMRVHQQHAREYKIPASNMPIIVTACEMFCQCLFSGKNVREVMIKI